MTAGLCFWILMLIWLVFGLWQFSPVDQRTPPRVGGWLLLFLLIALLGWHDYGAAIHQ